VGQAVSRYEAVDADLGIFEVAVQKAAVLKHATSNIPNSSLPLCRVRAIGLVDWSNVECMFRRLMADRVAMTRQSSAYGDDLKHPQISLPSLAFEKPRAIVGAAGMLLGLFAVAAPFLPGKLAFVVLGALILAFGLLQNYTGFGLADESAAFSWFSRGGASILTGLLLLAMPKLTFAGLAILFGLSWIISGVSEAVSAVRRHNDDAAIWSMIDGVISILLGVMIAVQKPIEGIVSVGLFVGLRCFSAGWSILTSATAPAAAADAAASTHPDVRLRLPPHAYFESVRTDLAREEMIRSRNDRGWCWLFLFTFFAVHVCRMDVDWTFVGLLSPAGAVVGDAMLAVVVAFGLVAPISILWRASTITLERRAWNWRLATMDRNDDFGWRSKPIRWWLSRRLRSAVRRSQMQGSPTAAVGWGLRTGLPAAAILMAMTPLWGVSWFFNTETWVAGIWEAYAEQRADSWREQMVAAVIRESNAGEDPDFFRVTPDGVERAKDFSFIVIGDTGEGDASQQVLHDRLLAVGGKPDVKFLVVASDVIYPAGAMKDYERKFYLPFKGIHKPIFAVPGNHDWYDALDSFTANFLDPNSARIALRARREAELKLTTTTESRIDDMIREAGRLRREYGIDAARQRAPYFEMHTERFSLVAVDTGILRRIDDDQFRWLGKALDRAGGRFKMVILGHPLYAGGAYQGAAEKDFAAVHALLKKHSVDVVMAGDTHDFEYYKEPTEHGRSMYHFVNGGGGAYISIGTALAWPKKPPVEECGFYPSTEELTASLEKYTPSWRWPFWLWVKLFSAWPSSPEATAAAFDYDHAPFFQSFMEIRVEGSTNAVRLHLNGANGRLRWKDLHVEGGRIPNGATADDLVEFAFPLSDGPR
jgi:uncharacterized membrane protein HdeD (DUF308 family)/3',5'-cyclic AMP phosphodiesterase CpdA